jgi:hypothetical protein
LGCSLKADDILHNIKLKKNLLRKNMPLDKEEFQSLSKEMGRISRRSFNLRR